MENDTAHSLAEFGKFPWHRLTGALNWQETERPEFQVAGVSIGGVVADVSFNRRPHINFVRPDGSVEAWEIPQALWYLVVEYYKRGLRDKEREIQKQCGDVFQLLIAPHLERALYRDTKIP